MYDRRGKAIQAIQLVLNKEWLRNSDYALSLVLMLLFGEVSISPMALDFGCQLNLVRSRDSASRQPGRNILRALRR